MAHADARGEVVGRWMSTLLTGICPDFFLVRDMERAFRCGTRRSLSLARLRSSPKQVSGSEVRKSFVDFFCKEKEHLNIRSAPVFSLKDPTLAFTNAGMNQFKDVFLGLIEPASSRVANSQKCIRIGGSHNDLSQVGQDGTHHTFFEMLGNWSFGDYFKEESCRMSWELLTQVYEIPPERLYVTYFGGDEALGLEADVQVREIWREIGVKESHILAFGKKDNFWSGGVTGPCGPCTEIHYDHCSGRTEAGHLVNSGSSEVTELWNLVFTQFDRTESGELKKLKKQFVDTGMGLERLVAVLQGKTSNYDTDLFLPLFEVIRKQTGHSGYSGKYDGNSEDCSYRILADHSRMIAVALSDGMIPNHQYKVRGIIRKSFSVAKKLFGPKVPATDLLKEMSNHVAQILSDAYPEIEKNLPKIHSIIDIEMETQKKQTEMALMEWQNLKFSYPALSDINPIDHPQILTGLNYFIKNILDEGKKAFSGEDVFVLFDTYGIPAHLTEQLASKLGLGFDMSQYLEYERLRKASLKTAQDEKYKQVRLELPFLKVLTQLEEKNVPPTLDYYKYEYRVDGEGKYKFKVQETTVEAILCGDELVDEISLDEVKEDQEVGLILDRTQCFAEEGGQDSDRGTLEIEKEIFFDIRKVRKIKNFVLHLGCFKKFPKKSKVSVQNNGVLRLDEERRLNLMRNHTALHLVNACLRDELLVVGEKSSVVTPEKFSLELMVYNENFHPVTGLEKIEKFVRDFIAHGTSVKKTFYRHPLFLSAENVVFVPGELILSSEVPVIEINSGFKLSREYCTGTHVLRSSDLIDFVITKLLKGSNRVYKIEGVAGPKSVQIRKADSEMKEKWSGLKGEVFGNAQLDISQLLDLELRVKQLFAEANESLELSQAVRKKLCDDIVKTKKEVAYLVKSGIRKFLKKEVEEAAEKNEKSFVVHCVEVGGNFDPEDLEEALQSFISKPVFLLMKRQGSVAIQCIVPKKFVSKNFSAKIWLTESTSSLGVKPKSKQRHKPTQSFYLQITTWNQSNLEMIMAEAIKLAEEIL